MYDCVNLMAYVMTLKFHAILSRAAPILRWSRLRLSNQFCRLARARISRSSSHSFLDYVLEHWKQVSSKSMSVASNLGANYSQKKWTSDRLTFPKSSIIAILSQISFKFRQPHPYVPRRGSFKLRADAIFFHCEFIYADIHLAKDRKIDCTTVITVSINIATRASTTNKYDGVRSFEHSIT